MEISEQQIEEQRKLIGRDFSRNKEKIAAVYGKLLHSLLKRMAVLMIAGVFIISAGILNYQSDNPLFWFYSIYFILGLIIFLLGAINFFTQFQAKKLLTKNYDSWKVLMAQSMISSKKMGKPMETEGNFIFTNMLIGRKMKRARIFKDTLVHLDSEIEKGHLGFGKGELQKKKQMLAPFF